MEKSSFPYSYWLKAAGLLLLLIGLFSFFYQYQKKGVFDFNELCVGFSFGLIFIFFSKEKQDDEMIRQLKFKALARAVISTFFITHLYNYIFLNWRFDRSRDVILSVSAYQFLALMLTIATVIFYYLKHNAALKGDE